MPNPSPALLADVKVGDTLARVQGHRHTTEDSITFVKVVHCTPTRVDARLNENVVERFRREDGRKVGGTWESPKAEIVTQAHRDAVLSRRLQHKIRDKAEDVLTRLRNGAAAALDANKLRNVLDALRAADDILCPPSAEAAADDAD